MLDKPKGARSKFSATFGKGGDKEAYRLCFLFSYHLILTTRQSDDDGRLNLVPNIGRVPLSDAMLIEDPSESTAIDDDGKIITLLLFKAKKGLKCYFFLPFITCANFRPISLFDLEWIERDQLKHGAMAESRFQDNPGPEDELHPSDHSSGGSHSTSEYL